MSSQSLTTPAMFMVSADVLPISRNTDMLSANAAAALVTKMEMLTLTCELGLISAELTAEEALLLDSGTKLTLSSASSCRASMMPQGMQRKAKDAGAM